MKACIMTLLDKNKTVIYFLEVVDLPVKSSIITITKNLKDFYESECLNGFSTLKKQFNV